MKQTQRRAKSFLPITPLSSSHLLGLVVATALLSQGCVSTKDIESVQGQISSVQREIMQLQKQSSSKEEVAGLEAAVATQTESLLKSEADMQVGLSSLSQQIEELQANLEDTNYRLAQLSQQIAATNQELKSFRNQGFSGVQPTYGAGAAGSTSPGVPGTTGGGSQPASPQALYQSAYNDYLRGNFDLAVMGFRQYLDVFPDTELADNAVYWIGESYFGQTQFPQAIREFDTILNRYPRSDKSASALLKKAYAYLELNQQAEGVVNLQYVLREYPGSDEANLARQRLASLGVDG